MSEGPEIHRLSAEFTREFGGSRVTSLSTSLKKARAWLDEHPCEVVGREVLRVEPLGKNMLWYLEGDLYFHFHLLMFGKMRTYALGYEVPRDRALRAHLVTTTRQMALYNGQVFNIGAGDPVEEIPGLRDLGPDICTVPFDRELFLERLNRHDNRERETGPVLLDQTVAAGLGNYLKSDILFECRINPWTHVKDLTSGEQDCLATAIPEVAQRALKNHGQTVTDEVLEQLAGEGDHKAIKWRDKHWVFRQSSRPCKMCGARIMQRRQGPGEGRVTFFCPNCQNVQAA